MWEERPGFPDIYLSSNPLILDHESWLHFECFRRISSVAVSATENPWRDLVCHQAGWQERALTKELRHSA